MWSELDRYYRALELEPGASAEQIRKAWKELSRVWHPDRFQNDPVLRARAEERLKEINEAYQVLSRSPGRQRYERGAGPGGAESSSRTFWSVRDERDMRHARDLREIRFWIMNGHLDSGDQVRAPGSETWMAIGDVPELATAFRIALVVRAGRWLSLFLFMLAFATKRPQLALFALGIVMVIGFLRRL